MNIVQIIPLFDFAGAEIMCETLIKELANKGHNVSAISLYNHHSKITERLEEEGVKIYYLNKKRGLDLTIYKKLTKILKEIKPDIVHTHLYSLKYATLACRKAKVYKIVHTVHNVAKKEVGQFEQIINYFLYRCYNITPVSLSKEIQQTIIERYKLVESKSPIVYNGINLSKYKLKDSYKTKDKIRYIHIGRFTKQKNHELLIRAFYEVYKTNSNVELCLIGKGELKNNIKELASAFGLQDSIHFLGIKENVANDLYDSDVFVLSSIYEGVPITIIEAMAAGLPIVSTNVGGIPTMIDNENDGLLVDIEVDELAKAMVKMFDESYRAKLGINARKKAEELFSSKAMVEKYLEVYK